MSEATVAQLRQLADHCPAKRLSLVALLWDVNPPAYEEWVSVVEQALLLQIDKISEKRNYLSDFGEDALTTVLQIGLDSLHLSCSAAVVNGNVDLVIEHRGYKWLGEAKIATGSTVIYHGYNQLTTRYATGQPNQTAGGMLLYCKDDTADGILAGWRAALEIQRPDAEIVDGPVPLSFRSVDSRNGAGQRFSIIHLAVSLHHSPQEDTDLLSKDAQQAYRRVKASVKAGRA
ncbi:hypothetical protein [Stenotrophomonas maltophilia]|uniref:hypothetical protein n=1 Tax=Stenotrophomonas maltophilia TaxID=40324 RepID=UPI00163AC090|nr:hypothetical protein [Stenotrophomonas maltophilia]QNG95284.1 hypothetical protein AEPCKKLL_02032 [Stenotrophomonas maltophilia]HDS1086977.1 hypothetical protein [Stenotrophomonas maltophilia]